MSLFFFNNLKKNDKKEKKLWQIPVELNEKKVKYGITAH
jgi:hypothetical protein